MKEQILSALEPFGFNSIGVANVTQPLSLSFYEDWLRQDLHADMKYLETHLDKKDNLNRFLPKAKSVICVTQNYFDHPKAKNISPMKIASYAKGEDYHYFFKDQIQKAAYRLKELFPDHEFKSATDAQPILERDFSYQAQLGWVGKNTMLISQTEGSYFLIGEIVTTLDIENTNSSTQNKASENSESYHPDRCGTCTKCIEACPTQALTPKKLDAAKCISYWTIESKKIPPLILAEKFDSWFFGCDICQDVCPWNLKKHSLLNINKKNETIRSEVINEILEILKSSNKSLEKRFFGTPLSRARGFGLKRNALIVALNMKATEIVDELKAIDLNNEELNHFKNEIINNHF